MIPVIAVFDIGKTNKKLLLFDSQYRIIREIQTQLTEGHDDDGFPCENINLLTEWMRSVWSELQQDDTIEVRALHFSGYGASFVHLNRIGNPVTPLYSYFKPFPDTLKDEFYERYGGETAFAAETASPPMGMLNSGLQLYWLKRMKPEMFAAVYRSLHLPQYCSYVFTNVACNEYTSIGCHTALWDFTQKRYHPWVYDETLHMLFPEIQTEVQAAETNFRGVSIPVGVGLHDSSAALIPYMSSVTTEFILISTGTWCINLNPFARNPLSIDEVKRDCLAYMTFHGAPVMASRVLLGGEHDFQVKRIAAFFNQPENAYKNLDFNTSVLAKLSETPAGNKKRLVPQTMHGTGPFPNLTGNEWDLSVFSNFEEAYHQLMLDLACLVRASIELIDDENRGHKTYIIDGGFGNNRIFMTILASLLHEAVVQSSRIAQAAALGAAILMHDSWGGKSSIDPEQLCLEKYSALSGLNLNEYYRNTIAHYG
jgi:L-fuculokinase